VVASLKAKVQQLLQLRPRLALLPSAHRASRLMPRLQQLRLPKTENKDAAAFTQKIPQGTRGP